MISSVYLLILFMFISITINYIDTHADSLTDTYTPADTDTDADTDKTTILHKPIYSLHQHSHTHTDTHIDTYQYTHRDIDRDKAVDKRKVLALALDGTRGDIFYSLLVNNKLPNFQRLLQSHNGRTSICRHVYDSQCATTHSGAYTNSTLRSFSRSHYSLMSKYVWLTTPGWLSVLTGVDNNKHLVENNDNECKIRYYQRVRHQYPTFLLQSKQSSYHYRTAATGTPDFLSSTLTLPSSISSLIPSSLQTYLAHTIQKNGIIDFECTDQPDATSTKTCNLDYRLAHVAFDPWRDVSSTVFARQHITGSVYYDIVEDDDAQAKNEQEEKNANDSLCADVIVAHYDMIDHAGHHHGFGDNHHYRHAIKAVDQQFGELLDDIENAVSLRNESWLVIVTSDHGGYDTSHMRHFRDDEIIPFMMATIQSPTIDPSQRIELNDLEVPIKHYDVAPTVLRWLNVESTVDYDGKVQALE